MTEEDPLPHPTPSGIIEPICIFRCWAEKIDEARVEAIIGHPEADGAEGMPGNHSYSVVSIVEVLIHVGCHDAVLGATPDAHCIQDNACHRKVLNNFTHLLQKKMMGKYMIN